MLRIEHVEFRSSIHIFHTKTVHLVFMSFLSKEPEVLTPLHSDVTQSKPSHGRKLHSFSLSGFGSLVQSASSNASILSFSLR